jgi:HK97 family phage major capsid protein
VFSQPTITAHKTQASIPYSIEVGMDYPGFANQMGRVLSHGYRSQMASTLAVGAGGSSTPVGIFTALDANTNVELDTDTTGALVGNDIDKTWAALPEDWRDNATWFFSVSVDNAIRALSAGDNYNRFTVDQTSEGVMILNGRPVVLSDYCPTLDQTTGTESILVVGDFENFVVAQRLGMTVDFVPHKRDSNGLPTGEHILYAYSRWGSDSVNDVAFRLLQDQA